TDSCQLLPMTNSARIPTESLDVAFGNRRTGSPDEGFTAVVRDRRCIECHDGEVQQTGRRNSVAPFNLKTAPGWWRRRRLRLKPGCWVNRPHGRVDRFSGNPEEGRSQYPRGDIRSLPIDVRGCFPGLLGGCSFFLRGPLCRLPGRVISFRTRKPAVL